MSPLASILKTTLHAIVMKQSAGLTRMVAQELRPLMVAARKGRKGRAVRPANRLRPVVVQKLRAVML